MDAASAGIRAGVGMSPKTTLEKREALKRVQKKLDRLRKDRDFFLMWYPTHTDAQRLFAKEESVILAELKALEKPHA